MKKNELMILCALFVFNMGIAQRQASIGQESVHQESLFATTMRFDKTLNSQTDTLLPPSSALPCASVSDSLTILTLNPSEWLFGCNSYGDTEGTQVYDIGSSTFNIEKLICFVQKMGTTGSIYAKVYEVNPSTNAPTSLIATSLPRLNSSIPSNPMVAQMVDVSFDSPVEVTGKFAVAIEWFYDLPNGSAMGLASSRHTCTVDSEQNSWIKDASGVWFSSQSYTLSNAPLLTDLFILPVGSTSVGMAEVSDSKAIQVFPIPAQNHLNVYIHSDLNPKAELKLINLQGMEVLIRTLSNGLNSVEINGIESGAYFYQVLTDGQVQQTGKLLIQL